MWIRSASMSLRSPDTSPLPRATTLPPPRRSGTRPPSNTRWKPKEIRAHTLLPGPSGSGAADCARTGSSPARPLASRNARRPAPSRGAPRDPASTGVALRHPSLVSHLRWVFIVRSAESLTMKVALHHFEPRPPGLIGETLAGLNVAVWSPVSTLHSPFERSVS